MKSRVAVALVLMLVLAGGGRAAEPVAPLATVDPGVKNAQVLSGDAGVWQSLGEGHALVPGNRLRTGQGGGVVLRLADGALVKLAPLSFARVLVSERGTPGIDLNLGKVWVLGQKGLDNLHLVQTPHGRLLDRDGSLSVAVDRLQTHIEVTVGRAYWLPREECRDMLTDHRRGIVLRQGRVFVTDGSCPQKGKKQKN